MARTVAWYEKKADALVHAWRMQYGTDPPFLAIVLALAVAIHETNAGESWPGPDGIVGTCDDEHNWGATTLRALNAAERTVLSAAGILPTVGPVHEARAKAAMLALATSGLPLPQAVIHCDSAPNQGPYFVWFASFKTDVDGAAYFLKLLCGVQQPKAAKAVLLDPAGTELRVAAAMYGAGYYTGFYKKKSVYHQVNGKWVEVKPGETPTEPTRLGADLNIAAYGGAMRALTPGIRLGLKDWQPPSGEPTLDPAPEQDICTGDTEPAPPPVPSQAPAALLPLEVDWDEVNRARDELVRDE